jgi:hypothetical protein
MKTITAVKLLAFALIGILLIGPATAATGFNAGKSALIADYKSSSTDFGLKPNPKPDWATFDPYKQFTSDLNQRFPKPDLVCSECAFNNATRSFGEAFMGNYSTRFKFYFGGGGGAPAGGGGGCCS